MGPEDSGTGLNRSHGRDHTEEQVFMSIDDLCGNKKSQPEKTGDAVNPRNTVSMENLIHELISDRLLELSR